VQAQNAVCDEQQV